MTTLCNRCRFRQVANGEDYCAICDSDHLENRGFFRDADSSAWHGYALIIAGGVLGFVGLFIISVAR